MASGAGGQCRRRRCRQGHSSWRCSVFKGVVKVVGVDEWPVLIDANTIGGLAGGLASAFLWLA